MGEDGSMKKRECPERCMLDDRRNVLEDQVLKIAFFGIRVPLSLVQGYFWVRGEILMSPQSERSKPVHGVVFTNIRSNFFQRSQT